MQASLPMYDLPEVRAATDAWWSGVAAWLGRMGIASVPSRLTRPADVWAAWRDPALLLSQCCGYALAGPLAPYLKVVATPCYAAPGCAGPSYTSAVVVHAEETRNNLAQLRGAVVAYNERWSHSGYNALRAQVAPLAQEGHFFSTALPTGSHAASLELVARGRADVTAVDAVVWALLGRHRPQARQALRVLTWTEPAPGLPYVTAAHRHDSTIRQMRAAVEQAMRDPGLAAARETLLLDGAAFLEAPDYAALAWAETRARALGYPQLA